MQTPTWRCSAGNFSTLISPSGPHSEALFLQSIESARVLIRPEYNELLEDLLKVPGRYFFTGQPALVSNGFLYCSAQLKFLGQARV